MLLDGYNASSLSGLRHTTAFRLPAKAVGQRSTCLLDCPFVLATAEKALKSIPCPLDLFLRNLFCHLEIVKTVSSLPTTVCI